MLNKILFASLQNRVLVVIAALAVCALGLWKAVRMPIDVLPDLNRPVVTVMTEAHGMVPEDVERLVTWPIEQVMNGATGVFRVRSDEWPRDSRSFTSSSSGGRTSYLDRQDRRRRSSNSPLPMLPVGDAAGARSDQQHHGASPDRRLSRACTGETDRARVAAYH